MNLKINNIPVPYHPSVDMQEIEKAFKGLRKVNYNRFKWYNMYEPKKAPLHPRRTIVERIQNGDFDLSHYHYQIQFVEHKLNALYRKTYPNQEVYVEEGRMTIQRRKKLLEAYLKDEEIKLDELSKGLAIFLKTDSPTIYTHMESFEGTPTELLNYLLKIYKNN